MTAQGGFCSAQPDTATWPQAARPLLTAEVHHPAKMQSDARQCKITPLETRNANDSFFQRERLPQKAPTAAGLKMLSLE